MKTLLLALLLPLPSQEESHGVVLLEDGSYLHARLKGGSLELKTEFGSQRIPAESLVSVRRVSDVEVQVRTERLTTTGELARDAFEFETALGPLTIPVRDIQSITQSAGPTVLLDASTRALWAAGDGACVDLVKDRTLEMKGMTTAVDEDGTSALVRENEGSYAQAAADKGLEVPDGDFTIEVRFKAGTATKGYLAVLGKCDPSTGRTSDYFLYAQKNGALRFQSVSRTRGTIAINTPHGLVDPARWTYVAVVSEPARPRITIYVNGKQAYQKRQKLPASSSGHPLFLGTTPPYRSNFACAERIQFVRLSDSARSAESVADLQRLFSSDTPVTAARRGRGVMLADGGFLRGDLPSLEGAEFRTKHGTVRLPARLSGRVRVFRHREEELPDVLEEVRTLIDRLREAGIEAREDAVERLIEIGEPAVGPLRSIQDSPDREVATRVEEILRTFASAGVLDRPARDVLEIEGTVLHGWLDVREVEVESRYGTLKTELAGLREINLGERTARAGTSIRLRSGEIVRSEPPKDTTLELDTGFGALKIPLREVKGLKLDEKTGFWTVRTDRTTASGTLSAQTVRLRTPAGAIEIPVSGIAEIAGPD